MVELSIPPDRNAPTGTSAIDWPRIAVARVCSSSSSAAPSSSIGSSRPRTDDVAVGPVALELQRRRGSPSSGGSPSGLAASRLTVRMQPGCSLNTRW